MLTSRAILIKVKDNKFVTVFLEENQVKWEITSYVIMSHEIMVDWIENGRHPDWQYT